MAGKQLERILDQLTPEVAVREMGRQVRKLFPLLNEDARIRFVINLVEEPDGEDKVSSLVHL